MKVGAHVSSAGGLDKAIDRAKEMGAEAIQLFCSPPQSWRYSPPAVPQVQAFKSKAKDAGIGPVFLHAIYLVNLGAPDPVNLAKGVESLTNHMHTAAQIEASGVILHMGSHRGAGFEAILAQATRALQTVLEQSEEGVWLVMENAAGMGQHIGASFEEMGRLLKAVGSPRVKVCLDTQHCFAAGYNVADREGLEKTMAEFHRHLGLDKLVAVHANDSKPPLGAGVDRHENIGQGHIGVKGFEVIMAHPAFKDVPFLLEVPGTTGAGPEKADVDILKEIRAKVLGVS